MSRDFLSCDWGTSHFRLRLVDARSLEIRAEIKTEEGATILARQFTEQVRPQKYAEVLTRHSEAILRQTGSDATCCVVSGMPSSTIGWIELPYALAPLPLTAGHLEKEVFEMPVFGRSMAVTLISGIRTDRDMMRGEECELLGLLENDRELSEADAYMILPGTHSKHAHLKNGTLVAFVTFMTGELFDHLHGLPTLLAALVADEEWSDEAFHEGVRVAKTQGLSAGLFRIRAKSVLARLTSGNSSFLSGLLIGSELLCVPGDRPSYLAASPDLQALYLRANEQIGLPIHPVSPEAFRSSTIRAHRMFLP